MCLSFLKAASTCLIISLSPTKSSPAGLSGRTLETGNDIGQTHCLEMANPAVSGLVNPLISHLFLYYSLNTTL